MVIKKQSNIIFSLNANNICQSNSIESKNVIDLGVYLTMFEKDLQQNPENDYISLFMYDTCPARFIGREQEMSMLEKFVKDRRKTLWWALTGAGGVGKTRLAYEFVLQLRKTGWLACFVNFPQLLNDLSKSSFKLAFKKNILIVIDYVYAYEANIAQIIEIIERANTSKKVRFLLIEREYVRTSAEGKIIAPWEDFFSSGFNNPSIRLRTQYSTNNLNLNNSIINDQDAKNIIKSFCKKRKKDIDDSRLEFILDLAKNKGDTSPLLLLLMAEYYCDNNDIRLTLNVYDQIVREIVYREMRIIYKTLNLSSQFDIECFNCLMLAATILGDFNLSRDINKLEELFYGEKENFDKMISNFKKSPLCFFDGNRNAHIRGLRPDLIGERFALEEFLSYTDNRIVKYLKIIQNIDSVSLTRFLLRFTTDSRAILDNKDKMSIFEQFLPDDRMTFNVVSDKGELVTCEVLFTFEGELTNKNYIVYTDNTIDKDGNTKVYASIYNPNENNTTLLPIETDEEWALIETILNELQASIFENNIKDMDELNDIVMKKLNKLEI